MKEGAKFFGITIFLLCFLNFSSCHKENNVDEFSSDPVGADRALPYEITDWMSRINGNKYLSEITIPGTHDCGADLHTSQQGAESRQTICQHFRLENQLKLGVRWFDVRINDNLSVFHWKYYLHKSFDDLLTPALAFVKQHPGEAVIFMIKQENSSISDHEFGLAVENKVASYGMEKFFIGNYAPKLSEVRGKIVIVKQFAYWNGHDFGMRFQWSDNTKGASFSNDGVDIYVQDHYKLGTVSTDTKVAEIKDCIDKSNQESNPRKFYINFTSGEKNTVDLRHISDDINPKIKSYLSLPAPSRNGVILVNFAGGADDGSDEIKDPDLVKYIINTNLQMNRIRYFIGRNLDQQGNAASWSGLISTPVDTDLGYYTSDGGAAVADLNNNNIPDLILMTVTVNAGCDDIRYLIGYDLHTSGFPSFWGQLKHPDGSADIGDDTAGGGLAVGDITGTGSHSLICMDIANNTGMNNFRYQTGLNLSDSGSASGWMPLASPPGNLDIGCDTQGGGADLTYIDTDPRPDLVLMALTYNTGMNDFRYVIAWNLHNNGTPSSWSGVYSTPGLDIGYENAGAGLAITNIDSNPLPDLVLVALTDNGNSEDDFRYVIGWNMKSDGNATSWSELKHASPQGVGYNSQGAGAALADIDHNGRPELILMKIDDPIY